MAFSAASITQENARVFRITHVDNVAWILANGAHCPASPVSDPNHVNIGNLDLIEKRRTRMVPIEPRGTLSDYVPFYFTPFSPMLYNIKTGYGVVRRPMREIAILHTTLHVLVERGIPFVFSDRHAYLTMAKFSRSVANLDRIDWRILQERDFARDPEDPGKMDRYQAEALVHRNLPADALAGIACHTPEVKSRLETLVEQAGLDIRVTYSPTMYL